MLQLCLLQEQVKALEQLDLVLRFDSAMANGRVTQSYVAQVGPYKRVYLRRGAALLAFRLFQAPNSSLTVARSS